MSTRILLAVTGSPEFKFAVVEVDDLLRREIARKRQLFQQWDDFEEVVCHKHQLCTFYYANFDLRLFGGQPFFGMIEIDKSVELPGGHTPPAYMTLTEEGVAWALGPGVGTVRVRYDYFAQGKAEALSCPKCGSRGPFRRVEQVYNAREIIACVDDGTILVDTDLCEGYEDAKDPMFECQSGSGNSTFCGHRWPVTDAWKARFVFDSKGK